MLARFVMYFHEYSSKHHIKPANVIAFGLLLSFVCTIVSLFPTKLALFILTFCLIARLKSLHGSKST